MQGGTPRLAHWDANQDEWSRNCRLCLDDCTSLEAVVRAKPDRGQLSTRCGPFAHRTRGEKAVVQRLDTEDAVGRYGRRQRGGPDAPCPPVRYAALLLYLRIRPTPLPACAMLGFFVEDTQRCCSGMRGDAIAEVKEEDRVAGRGTRSNCVTPQHTAVPISAKADRRSRPLLAERSRSRHSRRRRVPTPELRVEGILHDSAPTALFNGAHVLYRQQGV